MEYNFSIPLFSYEDNISVEDTMLNKVLAKQLETASTGNPMKLMYWAIELYKNNKLHLDEVDTKLLKDFIEQDQRLINLAKYQLIQILDQKEDK